MSFQDMLDRANVAFYEGRRDDAHAWFGLMRLLDMVSDDSLQMLTAVVARATKKYDADPLNEFQKDRDEYNEEMSLGGRKFRS